MFNLTCKFNGRVQKLIAKKFSRQEQKLVDRIDKILSEHIITYKDDWGYAFSGICGSPYSLPTNYFDSSSSSQLIEIADEMASLIQKQGVKKTNICLIAIAKRLQKLEDLNKATPDQIAKAFVYPLKEAWKTWEAEIDKTEPKKPFSRMKLE